MQYTVARLKCLVAPPSPVWWPHAHALLPLRHHAHSRTRPAACSCACRPRASSCAPTHIPCCLLLCLQASCIIMRTHAHTLLPALVPAGLVHHHAHQQGVCVGRDGDQDGDGRGLGTRSGEGRRLGWEGRGGLMTYWPAHGSWLVSDSCLVV